MIAWKRPCTRFIRLNIDGSSKGNPGTTGASGFLREMVVNIGRRFHGEFKYLY